MLGRRQRALGLRERDGRRRDLRLELPHVELRREPLREARARDLERRLARAQRPLGDRALLIELEELQIARRDVADERQHRRALGASCAPRSAFAASTPRRSRPQKSSSHARSAVARAARNDVAGNEPRRT